MSEFSVMIGALRYSWEKSKGGKKKALECVNWIANKIPKRRQHIYICVNCKELIENTPKIGLEQFFDYEI